MKTKGFFPTEIIFAVTDKCNLHCAHCYVKRSNLSLDTQSCVDFLNSIPENSPIEKIGFSGGEPFLNLELVAQISKCAVKKDFMFDRLMTNGVWWKDIAECRQKLQQLYNSGFDGTIGISWDKFHGSSPAQIASFIKECRNVSGGLWNIEIQSVVEFNQREVELCAENFHALAEELDCSIEFNINIKKQTGFAILIARDCHQDDSFAVYCDITPRTYSAENPLAWKDKKWFKEDYCQGPGNVLYVNPDGSVAPCCGFANECKELSVGKISEGYEKLILNGNENPMINLCYNKGLIKVAKKFAKKLPGKCRNECTLCQYVCQNSNLFV